MSKGLGRVQRECLRVIAECEAAGKRPTTFNVACEVYHVPRDRNGDRLCSDAQHVATKRALAGLRRKGLVAGEQEVELSAHGERSFVLAKSPTDGRAERCCFWSMVQQPKSA